jgi:hypothetical protein
MKVILKQLSAFCHFRAKKISVRKLSNFEFDGLVSVPVRVREMSVFVSLRTAPILWLSETLSPGLKL